jgi:hypothetical protein
MFGYFELATQNSQSFYLHFLGNILMDIRLLQTFQGFVPGSFSPCVISPGGERGSMLAIAYVQDGWQKISFALFDLSLKQLLDELTCTSPEPVQELALTYDTSKTNWGLAQITFSDELLFRIVTFHEGLPVLTDAFLLEKASVAYSPGPMYHFAGDAHAYTLLYMKRPYYNDVPTLTVQRVFPEGHRVQILNEVFGYTDGILAHENGKVIVILTLQERVLQEEPERRRQYSFSLAGYTQDLVSLLWRKDLPTTLPAKPFYDVKELMELRMTATIVDGPIIAVTGRPTCIVGVAASKMVAQQAESTPDREMAGEELSHLLWVSNEGELLRHCHERLYPRLHLTVSETAVVGVDVKEGQWRLWNWFPQHETGFHALKFLEGDIQRAYVVARRGKTGYEPTFWLIEQCQDFVRLSEHNTTTLAEVSPPLLLKETNLFSQEEYGGVLTWSLPVGLLPYEDTLLMLAVNAQRQVELYQVV